MWIRFKLSNLLVLLVVISTIDLNKTQNTSSNSSNTTSASNTTTQNTSNTTSISNTTTSAPNNATSYTYASSPTTTTNNTVTNTNSTMVNVINYTYAVHGDDWTGLCSTGQMQSPIDIQVVKGTCDNSQNLNIQFNTSNMTVNVINTGLAIMSYGKFSNLYATDINGDLYGYTAQYMVFRSPSEHSIAGKFYDMEMQIVHYLKKDFSNTYQQTQAVVSILFSVSSTDQPFFDAYNFASQTNISMNFTQLLQSQISETPTYYTYQGSQTVPGCAEIVNWYVLDTILPISSTQLASFTQYFSGSMSFASGNGNDRDIQQLNGRLVKQGGVVCQEQFVYFFSFFILYIFINYFIFKLL